MQTISGCRVEKEVLKSFNNVIKQSTFVFVFVSQYNTQKIYSIYVLEIFLETDQQSKIIPVFINHVSAKSVFGMYSSNTGYY